jgi:hypothetical protein
MMCMQEKSHNNVSLFTLKIVQMNRSRQREKDREIAMNQ